VPSRNELYAGMEHKPQRNAFASDRSAVVNGLAASLGSIPGLGDIAGLAADADMYASDPSSRRMRNYLLTGLGVLPFVPALASMGRATRNVPTGFGNEVGAIYPDALNDSQRAAFDDWFSGSQVVDASGNPKVLYHGTDVDFSKFDPAKVNSKYPYSFGVHFTDRPSEASIYAQGIDGQSPNGRVMPSYARAKNPLVIETSELTASMEADLNRADIIHKLVEAKRAGKPYDSVIIKRRRGDEYDGDNVIVFDADQIRTATGDPFK
jgi:hypothetical protein